MKNRSSLQYRRPTENYGVITFVTIGGVAVFNAVVLGHRFSWNLGMYYCILCTRKQLIKFQKVMVVARGQY